MIQTSSLKKLILILKKEGSENPYLEGHLLHSHLLDFNKYKVKTVDYKKHLDSHLEMIKKKIPVQRQLGFTTIKKLRFNITKDVLLPGPEIDVLIDACLSNIKNPKKIIDLCTGSGVIAITLGVKFKNAKILATDISNKALLITKINKKINNVKNVITLQGDLFKPISKIKFKNVDLIVSNPPYCKSEDIIKLPPQIKLYTPLMAVDGGLDGLFFHRIIINQAKQFLKNDGILILENETGQSEILKELLVDSGYEIINVYKNARNEERVIAAKIL